MKNLNIINKTLIITATFFSGLFFSNSVMADNTSFSVCLGDSGSHFCMSNSNSTNFYGNRNYHYNYNNNNYHNHNHNRYHNYPYPPLRPNINHYPPRPHMPPPPHYYKHYPGLQSRPNVNIYNNYNNYITPEQQRALSFCERLPHYKQDKCRSQAINK